MADLNIPKMNMKSDKYIFKKKLSLKRKSKKRLLIESLSMFTLSCLLVYINYLIPNKNLLFQNLPTTLNKTLILITDLFSNLYLVLLVIFIISSLFFSLLLFIGSFYRLYRITKRKTNVVGYK